eukprot:496669-Karenia_brevis.AAC.1
MEKHYQEIVNATGPDSQLAIGYKKMMAQLSYKVTPIAIVKDSRKLMDQIMQWEKAKEAKTKHHQMLLENKKKELDLLRSMAESLEKEIVHMEGEHSQSVKDMD